MVEHRQKCNQLAWLIEAHQVTAADRVLHKCSFSFDASVVEIFLPLAAGATIVIADSGREMDVDYLLRLVAEYGVTYIDLPPSLLEALLDSPLIDECRFLCLVPSGV